MAIRVPSSPVGRTQPSTRPLASFRLDGNTPDAYGAQVGRALSGLGNAVAAYGARVKENETALAGFDAQKTIAQESLYASQNMIERENAAPLGAAGFTDQVLTDYENRHNSILETMRKDGTPEEILQATELKFIGLREKLVNSASTFQTRSRFEQAKVELDATGQSLTQVVAARPEEYESAREEWFSTVDALPIDAVNKEALRKTYDDAITMAAGYALAQQEPELVVEAFDPQAPGSALISAIIQQESNGNAQALSQAGAAGLMQVMPATAGDIAKEIGDQNFPINGTEGEKQLYLMDKKVSVTYGTHYINKMLEKYNGDYEAALIAYNGGPKRADAWLAAGRNDSVIPTETQKYYKEVLGRISMVANIAPQVTIYDKTVGKIRDKPIQGWVADKMSSAAFMTDPNLEIMLVSGGQDPIGTVNGKRTGSIRHDHGHSGDIVLMRNGKPVTPAEDPALYEKFLENAAAAGFTGIGHYAWGVHVGSGSVAAWGPDTTKNTLDPSYAAAIERGRARRSGAMPNAKANVGRTGIASLDNMDATQRFQVLQAARTQQNVAMQERRGKLEATLGNAEAAWLTQGEFKGTEPTIADFYQAYKPDEAAERWDAYQGVRETGTFIRGMKTMSGEDIADQVSAMMPTDTASDTYEADYKQFEAAQKAAAIAMKARDDDPAGYALSNFPSIQQAWDAVGEAEYKNLARSEAYWAMQEAYFQLGIPEEDQVPFPEAQLAALKTRFAALTPDAQIQELVSMKQEMGGLFNNGLNQLSEKGMPVQAYLSGLVSESPQHVTVAGDVLRGMEIMAADPSRKPSHEALNDEFRLTLGAAQRGLAPTQAGAILDAAKALYVYKGGDPKTIDTATFDQAVRQVLGGDANNTDTGAVDLDHSRLFDNKVTEKTILPPGTTGEQFTTWIEGLTVPDISAYAGGNMPHFDDDAKTEVTPQQIVDDGVFVKVGANQYIVKMASDGQPLIDAKGEYFVMTITPHNIRKGIISAQY